MEPSQLGSLKGLMRDKEHEGLYWFGPFKEGKSLHLVVIGIARVLKARERIRFV